MTGCSLTRTAAARLLRTTLLAIALGLSAGTASLAAGAVPVTATGLPQVRLGETFTALHAAGVIGRLARGCSLDPGSRASVLRGRVQGSVEFSTTVPRRAADLYITGGAAASGVGIGDDLAAIRKAFAHVTVNKATKHTFNLVLVTVAPSARSRIQFTLAAGTGRVTAIGVPYIPFCE